MQLELTVALPQQPRSVVVARHLVRAAMVEMGVGDDCVHEIEVAVDGDGVRLMQALADRVGLATLPERGTVVSLEKRLVYAEP